MLRNLFRQRPDERQGDALYALAVEQARQPAFYTALGVADRIDARFELYTLHVLILFLRLKQDGERGEVAAQKLFDVYISSLDHTLRELGVGDVSVGKKMRKLGEAFYGRVKSYESAFAALPQTDHLQALLSRTVYEQGGPENAAKLGEYVIRQRAALAEQKLDTLMDGQVAWSAA